MKIRQAGRYSERIERVLRHIETSGTEAASFSLEDLSRVAAISPFHFHRVFRLMTGETVLECIRRVSFARAMSAITHEDATLEDAAEAAGYASGQSFARSLKAFAGFSAGELRADPAKMLAFQTRIERGIRSGDEGVPAMEIRIVDLEPLRFVAMHNVGAYEELFSSFGLLFEKISAWAGADAVRGIHGLWPDDPATSAPEVFRFDCGFVVAREDDPPAGTRWADAPAGPCLCVRHVGNYTALLAVIDRLYDAALETGKELRDAPLFTHYLDDPEAVPEEQLRTDVYLPIEVMQK